jgi:fibronectin type 3 domain-containing protein
VAPKGLSVVAGTGTINLSWDANTEADLAGYLVLRGDAPGDTLQPLTATPIAATNFEDKTAKPGVRYAYAIVAVDKAVPVNRSAPSVRIEETAR